MPNILVHFAGQGAASRCLRRPLDPRWIYLGCLLPDAPWIARRIAAVLALPVDPIDLRLYAMAQASLAGTLLLCAAFAAVAAQPRLVFAVLALNALLHLLLNPCEAKWGNGVYLFAPFSWRMTRFDFVAGEGDVMLPLSLAGAFLAAYSLAPLPLLRAVEASHSDSVSILRQGGRRVGSTSASTARPSALPPRVGSLRFGPVSGSPTEP